MRRKGAVEEFAIFGVDNWVVLTVDKEHRRTVVRNVLFHRQGVAHGCAVFAVLAQECPPAALVCIGLVHGHYRIDGCNEVGTQADAVLDAKGRQEVGGSVGSCAHAEMAACGETHDTDEVRIDVVVGGMFADILDSALDIAEGVWVPMTSADETCAEDVG